MSLRFWLWSWLRGLAVIASLVLLSFQQSAVAARELGFHIIEAKAYVHESQIFVDVDAELNLSEEVLDALLNGVALTVIVETELTRQRSILWDETMAKTRRDYQIRYHSLSRKYLVSSINGGESGSFRNLDRALDYIGVIRTIPLAFVDELQAGESYQGRARLVLAVSDLPAPLHLPAYFQDAWQLDSIWYEWSLTLLAPPAVEAPN